MGNSILTDIRPSLERRLSLYVQSTIQTSDKEIDTTVSTFDVLEMIQLTYDEVFEQLTFEDVPLKTGKTVKAGGFRKYTKDRSFGKFWDDVEANVREIIEATFQRTITLGNRPKKSTPIMVKRFPTLVVAPTIKHFKQFHPEQVIVGLRGFFNWMSDFVSAVEVNSHPDDILVARKTLLNLVKTIKDPKKERYLIIKRACEKQEMMDTLLFEDETADPIE